MMIPYPALDLDSGVSCCIMRVIISGWKMSMYRPNGPHYRYKTYRNERLSRVYSPSHSSATLIGLTNCSLSAGVPSTGLSAKLL